MKESRYLATDHLRVPPRIWVPLLAALSACAPVQGPGEAPTAHLGAAQPRVTVTCTLGVRTSQPCQAEAERACGGSVKIVNTTIAEPLPAAMERQGTPRHYAYRATYRCK